MNYFTLPTFLKKMPYKLPETGRNNWEILFKQDGILPVENVRNPPHAANRHPASQRGSRLIFSAWANRLLSVELGMGPQSQIPPVSQQAPHAPHWLSHQEKNKRPKFECDHEKFEIKYDQINSHAFDF